MHLNSEKDNFANENSTRMSNSGLDVRLRRQVPVTAKPPRLRLGIRGLSSHPQPNRRLYQQPDTSSVPVSSRNTYQSSSGTLDGGGVRKGYHPPYIDSNENLRNAVSNGSRPLIHHQRQNLKNRFQLLKTLGEGTYGKVKLAADKTTGEHVAIKYIKKTKIEDENDLIRIRREIQILSSLRHKHIVNIREVFERKDKIVLVLDYAQGGELYDYLNRMGKLSEVEARRIFRQIVSAIHYCHQNGIVHRDLKLENIILDDEGNVKIADFGLSNYYSHNSTLKTFCGSPLYASPEIVNGKPYHGPEVDVWSLGVILYTLVYGSMPFESNSLVSLKQQISQGEYSQPSTLSDAAGLIRHMLTVTPSRRATIEDALRHWWINFGHTIMPNDRPYRPDDEPPTKPYNVAAGRSSLVSPLDPPPVIHHRNQSSISSDSDIELDFRPNRWSKRSFILDSTGNSVSSSVAGSPDPTPESYKHSAQESNDDNPTAIAPGLLKLPPNVLEILKGCSSKSLAALLGTDKICSGFDGNVNSNNCNTSCQTNEEDNLEDSTESEKTSTVFDSERKPKRGILKRKGKFSGYDSGCGMPEDIIVGLEDSAIPKSGHLPRRLPSFRDEAHGIFASKHRASQLLDHTFDSLHQQGCSSDVPHTAWPYDSAPVPKLQRHEQHSPQTTTQDKPHDIISMDTADPLSHSEMNINITTSCCNGNAPSEIEPARSQQDCEQENSAKSSPESSTFDNISSKEPTKVIYRPKSILKKSSFDDGRNRLSISSIGSNSSADILDLSYDSGDNDHFVNHGTEHSLKKEVSSETATEYITDDMKSTSQRSYSLDQGLLNLHISAASTDLSYAGRHRSLSHEGQQILDSSSSMISRLTMDAQNLQ